MIISGGMNIYPAEIEAALEAHPDIYEAAVFGIPSDEWGETRPRRRRAARGAGARPRPTSSPHAREHLASYKVPRSITWSDELPKTGSGKILKRELRAPFWAGPRPARSDSRRGAGSERSAWPDTGDPRTRTGVATDAVGIRHLRRPAQRRQEHAAQRRVRQKVSIVSDKPQTTRTGCAASSTGPTPSSCSSTRRGCTSRSRRSGERVNATALGVGRATSMSSASWSTPRCRSARGDQWVAGRIDLPGVVIVNKVDAASKQAGARPAGARRRARGRRPTSRCRPRPATGVDELVDHLVALHARGPGVLPDDTVSDSPRRGVGHPRMMASEAQPGRPSQPLAATSRSSRSNTSSSPSMSSHWTPVWRNPNSAMISPGRPHCRGRPRRGSG